MQPLEFQNAIHSAQCPSARSNMTQTGESVAGAQPQLGEAKSALLAVEGACYKYRCLLSIEAKGVGFWNPCFVVFVVVSSIIPS